MENWPAEVVRAKGIVWLATRHSLAQSLSQAGPSIQFGPSGYWIAALPDDEQQVLLQEEPELMERWDPRFGDRINKLVMIGIDMDRARLIQSLDQCLLSDAEMALDWNLFPDEWPNRQE
ncbi:GTP-binding protein [Cohnella caldifontis]|uniref:GTP-binding protein n=1 Tax=Cohnella caldifontis TaxID=3027471 RepID=UPI0023EDA69D|nr:GTP-binding protein [Cohnella sp. YIM B05605]